MVSTSDDSRSLMLLEAVECLLGVGVGGVEDTFYNEPDVTFGVM